MPRQMGPYAFVVEAWTDLHATWAHKALVKLQAGQAVDVEILEGQQLLERARAHPVVAAALDALLDPALDDGDRLIAALTPEVAAALRGPDGRRTSPSRPVSRCGWIVSWPDSEPGTSCFLGRSAGSRGPPPGWQTWPPWASTCSTCRRSTPSAAPPARGRTTPSRPGGGPRQPVGHRESRGRPYRHPSGARHHRGLSKLVAEVRAHGMELALDYALQCSPDHPWVAEHPEWFHHRPDGSIAHAENPPEAVPGHRSHQLLAGEGTRPGGPVGRLPGDPAVLDRPRGHRVPGRQPPHQADRFLGVVARVDPRRASRGDLPF